MSVFADEEVLPAEYVEGLNKGYEYGKTEAGKSNTEKTFIPYETAKSAVDTVEKITLINSRFLIGKDGDYKELFASGFINGFEKGYKEIIKVKEEEKEPEEDAIFLSSGYGAAFGTNYGEIAGLQDYERGEIGRAHV